MKYGNENGIYAEVIADSMSEAGARVTTMEVQCHRFVLAEFNTHRVFSRNSASSRAIPVAKQIERVRSNPAMPVSWPAEQRGMQGGESLNITDLVQCQDDWHYASGYVADIAETLSLRGLHKSVVNRLLEPFMWHRIIVTATDWDGFWKQRCSPLAQPEIRVLAEQMREAYEASTPTLLDHDEWHLPYVTDVETVRMTQGQAKRVSVARCARVSYLTHDGQRDPAADVALYHRLVLADPAHWSPLEHVARPLEPGEAPKGNLTGWRQFRHDIEGEQR